MSHKSTELHGKALTVPSEETAVTEIELTSDGRIYLFGASPQFLMLLRDCGLGDELMLQRLSATAEDSNHSSLSGQYGE